MKINNKVEFTEEDVERAKESVDKQAEQNLLKKGVLPQRYLKILENENFFKLLVKETDKRVIGEFQTRWAILNHLLGIYVSNIQITPCLFVSSQSSAGKSYVVKQVFDLFPQELKFHKTKMSNESFTYWKRRDAEKEGFTWDGKILFLNDAKRDLIDGDTFKVMISEGTDAVIVRNQIAQEIHIAGKPILILTTANVEPNTEIMNRFNFVNLDESKKQTIDVNKFSANILKSGKLPEYNPDVLMALKLLKRVDVKIPFADNIADCFPIDSVSSRRYFPRFLALIQASASLHQFQREQENDVVIAQKEDYEIARLTLSKLSSNEAMFSMTHKTKKVYDVCLLLTEQQTEFTVSELSARCPIGTDKTIRVYLRKLQEYGLVTARVDDSTSKHRPPMMYSAKKSAIIKLPEFDKLFEK